METKKAVFCSSALCKVSSMREVIGSLGKLESGE